MITDNNSTLEKYKEIISKYDNLGQNISQALQLLLKENNITYLSVYYRVKEIESFSNKVAKKGYIDPFDEIEDICGVRIICYYQSDIERIEKILKTEFIVTENQNKEKGLKFDQFGYRSTHSIVKINNNWLNTPNYRGLQNLKAEIQIRTVLMHAWAEIEHKLAYKSESQIPNEFKRKLSRISAKLEESDEQFEEIKKQIEVNKNKIIETAKQAKEFDENIEFNLDNLQAFLDYAFPEREKDIRATSMLFEEMKTENIEFKSLISGYKKSKDYINDIERDTITEHKLKIYDNSKPYFIQVGAARTVLELSNDRYYKKVSGYDEMGIIKRYKKIIFK